ncbi:hypothetical protein [uncultured Dokdonia sp.]|nr:hypothetical protein [uncultured Dokdonia sp.]
MKNSLKGLTLNKEVISNLELDKIKGGGTHCCTTQDAFNSCPPPGRECF